MLAQIALRLEVLLENPLSAVRRNLTVTYAHIRGQHEFSCENSQIFVAKKLILFNCKSYQ